MPAAQILYVEDNDADFYLMQIGLERCMDSLELRRASDGVEAIALVKRLGNEGQPDLILLDINMPVMDGFTFLQALRNDERCVQVEPAQPAQLPVIMCSTSEEPGDLNKARGLGVAAYVTKPVRLAQLEEPLRDLNTLVLNRDRGAPRLERRQLRRALST